MLRSSMLIILVLAISFPASSQTSSGKTWYDLGVFSFEEKDYDKSKSYVEKALQSEPDNAEYNHLMGRIYLKTERYSEAVTYLEKAMNKKIPLSGLKFDLALAYYQISEFKKAEALFSEVKREEPSNIVALYYSGLCLIKMERYESALPCFVEVAEKSQNAEINSKYYAGVCYAKTGDVNKAFEMFSFVEKNAEQGSLKEYAGKWLDDLKDRKQADKPYFLYLKASLQYDDNAGLYPADLDLETEKSEKDDYVSNLFFTGAWDFFKRDHFLAGAGYSHYQSWYSDFNQYDLAASIFRLYSSYKTQSVKVSLDYSPSFYWVDSDSFLKTHQLKPSVTWKLTQKVEIGSFYRFINNDYEFNERDGNAHGLYVHVNWLAHEKIRVFAETGFGDISADYDIYAHSLWETNLIFGFNLPFELKLQVSGRYISRSYDETAPSHDAKREDDNYFLSASIARNIWFNWLEIALMHEYSENNSNIAEYRYERNITGISVAVKY